MNQIHFESELAFARTKLDTELDELIQLRPLPAIAMQIMNSCQEPQISVRELVKLVECDAAISSKILSVVNSSMYGYSRDVSSINQAVVVLGFRSLSQLAISIASEKVFSDGETAAQPRLNLYEHSLGCATIARLLAGQANGAADSGSAFLAGMLHDVGKLVFFDVAPEFYANLQTDHPVNPIECEQAAFGIDHPAVGIKFGQSWGLPYEISNVIANHHCVGESLDPILKITCLANELAKSWGVGQSQQDTQCETALSWLTQTGPELVDELQSQADDQYGELRSLMAS